MDTPHVQLAADMPQRHGRGMRYPPWLFWVAITLAILAIPFVMLIASAGGACTNGPSELVAEIKKANGCLEFWLNRYQALLSAGIAAAIALVVVRPVLKQLREMTRQSAKGAKELAESLAHDLERELEAVSEAARLSFYLQVSLDRRLLAGPRGWPEFEEPRIRQARIDTLLEQVTKSSRRAIGGREIIAIREVYLRAAGLFKYLVEVAETRRDMEMRMSGNANPPPDYESIDAVHGAWGAWAEAHNALSSALDRRIRELWHRVNALADEADGR